MCFFVGWGFLLALLSTEMRQSCSFIQTRSNVQTGTGQIFEVQIICNYVS